MKTKIDRKHQSGPTVFGPLYNLTLRNILTLRKAPPLAGLFLRNLPSKFAGLLLAISLAGCVSQAEHARQARDLTPIFGDSREIVQSRNNYLYRFAFRGGKVVYWPERGAQWLPDAPNGTRGTFAAGLGYSPLPNGCLVYACARAEQIRLRPECGETRSEVIGFRRPDAITV